MDSPSPCATGRGRDKSDADPAVTGEQIDALVGRLGGLTKDGLVTVADAIDLKGMKAKKKDDILGAMRQRFHARKGATQRAGLIDRPAAAGSTSHEPAYGPAHGP
jgi:hypothetical protein